MNTVFAKFGKQLTAIALVIGAGAASVDVHAASVSASAAITGISSSLLALSNNQYLSDASTPFQSGFDASSVLQNYYFNNTAANGDTSYAEINDFYAPGPYTQVGAIHSGNGSATVLWTFDYVATGTGTATLDLEYLYNATVANWSAGETGIASSSANLLLDGTALKQEQLHYFYDQNANTGGFSNLVLNFGVTAGQTGTFTVALTSSAMAAPAAVPVPAAVWLMGSALAGLGGIARRRLRVA